MAPDVAQNKPRDPLPGCTHADDTPCTIFDLTKTAQAADATKKYPPPIGPYLPVCLKYWSTHPLECLSH